MKHETDYCKLNQQMIDNKILRISEKWLFLRLSQLSVDKLYLCWRERATRNWSQTTEAGIKDKRNFRILSYLIFYPNIKFDFLGDILSATLSIILSITLSNIKSWEHIYLESSKSDSRRGNISQ